MKKTLMIALGLALAGGAWAQKATPQQKAPWHPMKPDAVIDGAKLDAQSLRKRSPWKTMPAPAIPAQVRRVRLQDPAMRVQYNAEGLPMLIEGHSASSEANQRQGGTPAMQAIRYAQDMQALIGLDNPQQELRATQEEADELGQVHIRLQQYYQGLPVYGGEMVVHLKDGQAYMLNGRWHRSPRAVQTKPAVERGAAIANMEQALQDKVRFLPIANDMKQLLQYEGPTAELVIDARGEMPKLVWRVSMRPNHLKYWVGMVDAQTGEVLSAHDHTCSTGATTATATDLNGKSRTVNTYQDTDLRFYMYDVTRAMYKKVGTEEEGVIVTFDLKNKNLETGKHEIVSSGNNAWGDRSSVSAHFHAGQVYEYFRVTHGRNSLNGKGGDILSLVNVADENGDSMENAYWNGQAIFYGNGGTFFKPLAGALDVAAHEFTHGVISNSANLDYQDESGAINESMADIFGAMLDRDDWKMGEDVIKSGFATGALRDLSNPHNGGTSLNDNGFQPQHVNEQYQGSEDNGGVHINSGIANFAFFKFATATTKEKAEKIYYRALTKYLTRSSKFVDLRIAVVQSATDLHGASSAEVAAAKQAFDQVGITGGEPTEVEVDLPPLEGSEFILSTDVLTSDPQTLYISDTQAKNFTGISQIEPYNKPSVSEDGSVVAFVSKDHRVRGIDLSGGGASAFTISNDPDWDNAALSKDGSKIALISTQIDTAIYIYHFEKKKLVKFKLYNPTFTEGVSVGAVLYADAIEWDHSGQYVMYDAYNQLKSASGEDISYWDVGVIEVWDDEANDFGSGEISKIFSDLPKGISAGNPSFSTTSPYIAVFDYFDGNTSYLLAANLERGQSKIVYENNMLNYADYSASDGHLLFNARTGTGQEVVAFVALEADKMTAKGEAAGLVGDAKWGIWFTQSAAVTGLEESVLGQSLKAYPNPSDGSFQLAFQLKEASDTKVALVNLLGQSVATQALGRLPQGSHELQLSWPQMPSGTYLLHIEAGTARGIIRIQIH